VIACGASVPEINLPFVRNAQLPWCLTLPEIPHAQALLEHGQPPAISSSRSPQRLFSPLKKNERDAGRLAIRSLAYGSGIAPRGWGRLKGVGARLPHQPPPEILGEIRADYRRMPLLAFLSRKAASKTCICPLLRWITETTSERCMLAMSMPLTITLVTL